MVRRPARPSGAGTSTVRVVHGARTMRRCIRSSSLAALLAAAIHAWFFLLESVWFMRPRVFTRFGLASAEQAAVVRSFAYNQGFYNLFLATGIGIGLALIAIGESIRGPGDRVLRLRLHGRRRGGARAPQPSLPPRRRHPGRAGPGGARGRPAPA